MITENIQIKNLHGILALEKEHVNNNLGMHKIMIEHGLALETLPPIEENLELYRLCSIYV